MRIVFLLLRQLQPYLSANNLTVVPPRRHTVMQNNLIQSMEGSVYTHNNSLQQTRHRSEAKYSNNRLQQRKNQGRSVDRMNSTRDQGAAGPSQGISLGNLLTNIKVNY